MAQKGMDIITVENLSKRFKTKIKEPGLAGSVKSLFRPAYKEIDAVDKVSFSIQPGELVGFIGPNGAGKSTTLKMLTGILYPTAGDAMVDGFVPWKDRQKLAYRIGSVFGQKPQLWYHLPPIDTFQLLGSIYDIPKEETDKRIAELVKQFEAEEFLHTPVRKLSLGQRMRAEIIASLLHQPKVLFLDEPTIGLDIIAKKRLRQLIKQLNEKYGLTIMLTSHDMDDIEKLCRRVIVINHGKVIYDGLMKDLKHMFATKKILSVLFANQPKAIRLKGVTVLKAKDFGMKLEVDTKATSLNTVLAHLVKQYDIEDLLISDPPIEEVIENIFNAKDMVRSGKKR